jgi:diguanylate cyclase (GGDEF)-like protein/PAS domain S-box-containing protein
MKGERLLIVEDEKIIALDLQHRLERFGYSVVGMAIDQASATSLARETKPDLVLMDIMLAGGDDGVAAALQIRRETGIPVIFITAYTDEATVERAKEVEPAGYILKPFKERELYTTIDIALYKSSIETKLRKQESVFSSILHTINDGIIATDRDYAVEFMNPVAEDLCGIKQSAAKGVHVDKLVSLADRRTHRTLRIDEMRVADDGPFFFHDMMVSGSSGQGVLVDGSVTKIKESKTIDDGYVIALRDITELRRLSETINYQASHDNLTGLSNREEFAFKLTELLRVVRNSNVQHTLLFIDIDRFKAVNDTCGALAGDELLRRVSTYLQANIQRKDLSARLGADEFAVVLIDCRIEDSANVARRLREQIETNRFVWQNTVFPVTVSIGAVPLDGQSEDIHSVLASADDACRVAKEQGGNRVSVYNRDDDKYKARRGEMAWIAKINSALEQSRFQLYYQTIAPLSEGSGDKVELLLRLVNEDGSIAPPMEFIPAAERYNLMPMIDRWVVASSFRSFKALRDIGHPLAETMFSINLSGPSLLDDSLISYIGAQIEENGLSPEHFCFEITETAAIQNLSYASKFMITLKAQGFTFALDDFGSGFSSFGYLKNLPVDFVKIDGSFVQNVDESVISYTMVESINSVGHVMGLKTIAEFVKSASIKEKLIEIGVDYAQGYEIARPQPLPLP